MTADGQSTVSWYLEAYAGHWLTDDELSATTQWMAENRMWQATAERPVTVEAGTITYGQDQSGPYVRAVDRQIVAVTVPLRTKPPAVWHPTCGPAALDALAETFRRHEWSAGHGGVCVDCSGTYIDAHGRVCCTRANAVRWPCPDVQAALSAAHIGDRQGGRHD